MDKKLLQDYARLIAVKGVAVEKGDEIWLYAGLDQPDFVYQVVEECYKAGAGKVRVIYSDPRLSKLSYKYMKTSDLCKIPPYKMGEYKYMAKKFPSRLYLESDDPNALKGINQSKLSKVSIKTGLKIKPYRNQIEGKHKWCIAGVPGVAWAKSVFPNDNDEVAVEKLWDAILKTSRVDGNDPVENWNKHNQNVHNHCQKLDNLNLKYLLYKSKNGTDFKVELIEGVKWGGGFELTQDGRKFNPNIPSEECFTSPKAGSCEGVVYATKPLSFRGEIIDNFYIKFKDGKVSEVHAEKNQKLLEFLVSADEGAKMLGECALVAYDSPINNTGILFNSTLYDENACCHLALGMGFRELLPGSENMNEEEIKAHGINDSIIHVDFMIGSSDLSIIGVDKNGKETVIFKEGNWAI